MCYAGSVAVPVEGKKGCTYFEWAGFDERGRPVWKKGGRDGKDGRVGGAGEDEVKVKDSREEGTFGDDTSS